MKKRLVLTITDLDGHVIDEKIIVNTKRLLAHEVASKIIEAVDNGSYEYATADSDEDATEIERDFGLED